MEPSALQTPNIAPVALTTEDVSEQRLRLLMVDDDAVQRRASTAFLKRAFKIDITAAGDGYEALSILGANERFDLVVTDYFMPDMDGAELITRIRAIDTRVPIVALTSSTDVQSKYALKVAGVAEVLTKPVTVEAFADVLYKLDLQT